MEAACGAEGGPWMDRLEERWAWRREETIAMDGSRMAMLRMTD